VPKQVNHEQRRSRLAEALWRIAARDGLEATTVRHVAAEAGVSVGMVQHYFSTKDEMLLFALQRIGDDLAARLAHTINSLPEPRDPYEVIYITLRERLPLDQRRRVQIQALVAWLGRSIAHPELTDYMTDGTRQLRDHLSHQLRHGQHTGRLSSPIDPALATDALLALTDGLASHLLQNLHTPESALAVLTDHLNHLFGHHSPPPAKP
jgi:AcrR family transcriptional regulator